MNLLTLAADDPVTMLDTGKVAVDSIVAFGGAALSALWKYGVGAGALYGVQKWTGWAKPKTKRR